MKRKARRRDLGNPVLGEVHCFIVNGQSLSVGVRAGQVVLPKITIGQVPNTYMFDNIWNFDDNVVNPTNQWTMVPMSTPMRSGIVTSNNLYPLNSWDETPVVAFGKEYSQLSGHVTTGTQTGLDGQPYSVIKKGGTGNCYVSGINEAQEFYNRLTALGATVKFSIIICHGESDLSNPLYHTYMTEMQQDYESDLQAINGQTDPVYMYLTQPSAAWFTAADSFNTVNQQLLDLAKSNNKIILVGSKMPLDYYTNDIHLIPQGSSDLGKMYARNIHAHKQGTFTLPLCPTSVVKTNSTTITLTMHVPVGQVSFNTTWWDGFHQTVNTQWANGKGFEVTDDSGKVTINSVTITGPNTIDIVTAAPLSTNPFLSNGWFGDGGSPTMPRRTQVVDENNNWLVQFYEPIV